MLIVLPPLAFISIFSWQRLVWPNDDWRATWLKAAVYLGLFVLASTVLLSLPDRFSTGPLAGAYLILLIMVNWLIWRSDGWARLKKSIRKGRSSLRQLYLQATASLANGGSKRFYYVLFTVVILALTLIVALVAAPNNYDSMTYHLARVIHWALNHSVAHYATSIDRQLYSGPLAEYAIAHLYLLTHSDRFFNLVQWLALFGSILAATLIVKTMGGGRWTQFLSAVFIVTAPEMILQSTSTQNDLVNSFLLLVLAYFVVSGIKNRRYDWRHFCLVGLTLGLGMLTKGTFIVFAAPFLVWYLITVAKERGVAAVGQSAVVITLIALGLNLFFLSQNFQIYHNLLGPPTDLQALKSQSISPRSAASTLIKDAGTAVTLPNQPATAFEYQIVKKINRALGMSPDDPQTNFLGQPYQLISQANVHEDIAGNPIQAVVIIILVVTGLVGYRRTDRLVQGYLIASILGMIAFAAIFKWQASINRLDLPFLALGSVLVVLTDRKKSQQFLLILFDLMFLAAIYPLLFNNIRPIFGSDVYPALGRNTPSIFSSPRADQYFAGTPGLGSSYVQLIQSVQQAGCQEVGLIIGSDTNEYQLFALDSAQEIHWHQILVDGPSQTRETPQDNLCSIARVYYPPIEPRLATIDYQGVRFTKDWESSVVEFYLPPEGSRRSSAGE